MKKIIAFTVVLCLLSLHLFPVETIVFKDSVDYLETLTKGGSYFRILKDIDYDNGYLYILDMRLCTVIVVDFDTGKRIRTIFTRGQGPNELMRPVNLKVKNNKVFVMDQGFNGIKIADVNGNPVREFRINGIVVERNLDVNDKGEIFVGEFDSITKTYVSVYNMDGVRQRTLIKINPGEKFPNERIHYLLRLDNQGNIVLLFNVLRELMKYSQNGELIWKRKIKNELLDKAAKSGVKSRRKGAINVRIHVSSLQITKKNNILVGHAYGGSLFDQHGNLKYLITDDHNYGIDTFVLIDNKLINSLIFGEVILLYDTKEKIQ
jgi:hypothetical protein